MKLSLAITSYNRYDLTIESFAQVIDDARIDDIVILDDASTDGSYEKLRDHFAGNEKVRVIRQAQNRGMSLNKRDAIALAKNEWVIIFDSDNTLTRAYLDYLQLFGTNLGAKFILCPDNAKPEFSYKILRNEIIDSKSVSNLLSGEKGKQTNLLLNTCNYVVNRTEYLKVYEHNANMLGTDTIWFNYLWLKSGNSFYVVPGMEYDHRVHQGSGFLKDVDYNMKQSEKIKNLILAL